MGLSEEKLSTIDCSASVATLCRATDMNASPFPEETYSSNTLCKYTADAASLSDKECIEEAEDSKHILPPSMATGNKDCQIHEETARLRDEKLCTFELTAAAAFCSDEGCK